MDLYLMDLEEGASIFSLLSAVGLLAFEVIYPQEHQDLATRYATMNHL